MPNVSIAVALTDNYSSKLSNMAAVSSQFEAELTSMGQTVGQLETIQADYTSRISKQRVEVIDARKELTSATAAYKSLGDEASQLRLEEASASFSLATQELKDLEKQALNTDNQIRALATSAEGLARTEYTSSLGLSDSSSSTSMSSTFSSVWAAGAADQVSDAVAEATSVGISSAFGSDAGTIISSALTGAMSGAAIGSYLGGVGLGTVVGAGIGTVAGTVTGATSVFSAEDDYFKEYVQSAVESGKTTTSATVSSGSAIAASRETDLISFTTLMGSEDIATDYLEQIKTMSNSTPFLYDDLTSTFKTLLAYGTELDDILPSITSVGDAGAALGLSTDDISTLATALGQMTSTDKSSLEYIKLLTERGISAIDWLAERDSISVADVYENISAGIYSGKETAEFFTSMMNEAYGGSMELQSQTTSGLASTLEGLEAEIASASGEGYNSERNQGVSSQIEWLASEAGDAMQSLYTIIGQNEAYMENLQEQYTREALSALLTGAGTSLYGDEASSQLSQMNADYIAALAEYEATGSQEAALELQNLSQTAETMAQMAYESSEQYKLVIDAEEDLIAATRDLALAFDGWSSQYSLQQEYTVGQLANASEWFTATIVDGDASAALSAAYPNSHADGLTKVPYDNYPALLHEGEQVLTAREVRSQSNGGIQIVIKDNNFTIREEADVERLTTEIARRVALENMAGRY